MSPIQSNRWNFKTSKEVSPALAPNVVIPPPPPPPPPTIVSGDLIDLGGGEFAGATNFSEFSVAAGLPSGITQFGIGSTSPTTHEIANDATEGNYFSMDGHSSDVRAFGYGFDAFDNVFLHGEILVRVFVNFDLQDFRRSIGGAARISGLVGQPSGSPDFDCMTSALQKLAGTNFRSSGLYVNNGSGSIPVDGLIQETFQNQAWIWIRVRNSQSIPDPSEDDWIITAWYGSQVDPLDISGQPGPDGTAFDRFRTIGATDALGWAVADFCDQGEQRIAFLSFSTDPTVIPPPLPATVIGGP